MYHSVPAGLINLITKHYVFELIFEDYLKYAFLFQQGSDVYNDGKEVQSFFDKLLSQYFPELELDEQAEDDDEED